MSKGTLYICATPIGNLEDITLRVLRVLGEVDLIAAEDTRHTAKLLHHYEIKTPTTSYHENNRDAKGVYLVEQLLAGKNVALVSDSGMPGVSDPGRELVLACYEAGVKVTVCPGATAGLSALVLSGLQARPHVFEGFLPRDKVARRKLLTELADEKRAMVFYEAPHRLVATLNEMQTAWGNRHVVLARELTKKFEEVTQGTISEHLSELEQKPPRGEYVIIAHGAGEAVQEFPESIAEHVQSYINNGMTEKDAMKATAKVRGVAKSEIYNEIKKK